MQEYVDIFLKMQRLLRFCAKRGTAIFCIQALDKPDFSYIIITGNYQK